MERDHRCPGPKLAATVAPLRGWRSCSAQRGSPELRLRPPTTALWERGQETDPDRTALQSGLWAERELGPAGLLPQARPWYIAGLACPRLLFPFPCQIRQTEAQCWPRKANGAHLAPCPALGPGGSFPTPAFAPIRAASLLMRQRGELLTRVAPTPCPLAGPPAILQHQGGQRPSYEAGQKPRRPVEGRRVVPWTQ